MCVLMKLRVCQIEKHTDGDRCLNLCLHSHTSVCMWIYVYVHRSTCVCACECVIANECVCMTHENSRLGPWRAVSECSTEGGRNYHPARRQWP